MYRYKAFGLTFDSEIELPGLPVADLVPEIQIRYGNVPASLDRINTRGVCFEAADMLLLLRIPGVARLLIREGHTVTIEMIKDGSVELLKSFLAGTVMAVLLQQRGFITFHGSAVLMNGHALLFIGSSGSGKSSLAASFINKGCSLIADDVCAVRFESSGTPVIYPSFPSIKLWHDVAGLLIPPGISKSPVREGIEKYRMLMDTCFYSHPAEIDTAIILNVHNKSTFNGNRLKGMERFNQLNSNIYRYRFIEGMGLKQLFFDGCTQLAGKIRIYSIIRPRYPVNIDGLRNYVLDQIGNAL